MNVAKIAIGVFDNRHDLHAPLLGERRVRVSTRSAEAVTREYSLARLNRDTSYITVPNVHSGFWVKWSSFKGDDLTEPQ